MKTFLFFFLLTTIQATAQSGDETAVRNLLQKQMATWNSGDVEGFMQTYWKSDSLLFVGRTGVVWGWQQTLDNYKKNYPGKAAMGTLLFDIVHMQQLSNDYYFVMGKWRLQRAADAPSGFSTLLVRRINGAWKIVSDHSS